MNRNHHRSTEITPGEYAALRQGWRDLVADRHARDHRRAPASSGRLHPGALRARIAAMQARIAVLAPKPKPKSIRRRLLELRLRIDSMNRREKYARAEAVALERTREHDADVSAKLEAQKLRQLKASIRSWSS